MRLLAVFAILFGLLISAQATPREQGGPAAMPAVTESIVLAQADQAKPKKKIQLRRVCSADQVRCACADTGTSACCKPTQSCVCGMATGAQCR